jgi:hypothetical protein
MPEVVDLAQRFDARQLCKRSFEQRRAAASEARKEDDSRHGVRRVQPVD